MKKNVFISLLVVAMSVMFISCDRGPFSVFKPNEELFEYTCYDKGSYWVYEDSATNEIDSLVVLSKPVKVSDENAYGGYHSRVVTFKFQYAYSNISTGFVDTFSFSPNVHSDLLFAGLGWHPEWFYTNPCHYINNRGEHPLGSHILAYINMPSPIDNTDGESLCKTNGLPWYRKYYQSYIIGENKYYDVKRIVAIETYKYAYKYDFDSIVTYWAKNIGVIRCEYYDSTSSSIMNLIKYDVKNLNKKNLKK
jgi:hypothetical protein